MKYLLPIILILSACAYTPTDNPTYHSVSTAQFANVVDKEKANEEKAWALMDQIEANYVAKHAYDIAISEYMDVIREYRVFSYPYGTKSITLKIDQLFHQRRAIDLVDGYGSTLKSVDRNDFKLNSDEKFNFDCLSLEITILANIKYRLHDSENADRIIKRHRRAFEKKAPELVEEKPYYETHVKKIKEAFKEYDGIDKTKIAKPKETPNKKIVEAPYGSPEQKRSYQLASARHKMWKAEWYVDKHNYGMAIKYYMDIARECKVFHTQYSKTLIEKRIEQLYRQDQNLHNYHSKNVGSRSYNLSWWRKRNLYMRQSELRLLEAIEIRASDPKRFDKMVSEIKKKIKALKIIIPKGSKRTTTSLARDRILKLVGEYEDKKSK